MNKKELMDTISHGLVACFAVVVVVSVFGNIKSRPCAA